MPGKLLMNNRVSTVREKSVKNEKSSRSGNFELSQGNLKFSKKSGKSQGILLSINCGNPEQHLEFLFLKGGSTDSPVSINVKMPNCRKSHAAN